MGVGRARPVDVPTADEARDVSGRRRRRRRRERRVCYNVLLKGGGGVTD